MSADKTKKQQKPEKQDKAPVANPGQPMPGNKNQGDDLETVIPRDIGTANRPTRDDGDNDDEGELK